MAETWIKVTIARGDTYSTTEMAETKIAVPDEIVLAQYESLRREARLIEDDIRTASERAIVAPDSLPF